VEVLQPEFSSEKLSWSLNTRTESCFPDCPEPELVTAASWIASDDNMFSKASSGNLLNESPAGSWTDFLFLLLHKSPESNVKNISHSKYQSDKYPNFRKIGTSKSSIMCICSTKHQEGIKPKYAKIDHKTIEQQDTCDP
jgi:hypothetical protein